MPSDFDDDRLANAFAEVPRLLAADPDLIRRGAFFDARFAVGIGPIPFDVTVAAGQIASFERGPFLMRSWRFAVRGTRCAARPRRGDGSGSRCPIPAGTI